jgi:hypothetical protein
MELVSLATLHEVLVVVGLSLLGINESVQSGKRWGALTIEGSTISPTYLFRYCKFDGLLCGCAVLHHPGP